MSDVPPIAATTNIMVFHNMAWQPDLQGSTFTSVVNNTI